MCAKNKYDKIINDNIRESVGVTHKVAKMVENRLMLLGHVEIKPVDYVVRRLDLMKKSQTTRGKSRQKTIREVIIKDLEITWSWIEHYNESWSV